MCVCDRPSKVTEFEHTRLRVQQQVLWLDVSMTDALRVQVCQAAEHLVHVQLHTHTQTHPTP